MHTFEEIYKRIRYAIENPTYCLGIADQLASKGYLAYYLGDIRQAIRVDAERGRKIDVSLPRRYEDKIDLAIALNVSLDDIESKYEDEDDQPHDYPWPPNKGHH